MEQEAIMIFSVKQTINTKSSKEGELVGVDDSLNFSLGKTMDEMADEKLS